MANQYARNPEKIANKVYGGRMGNGTEETGEGWKYRGRGIKQLTGKENYDRCGSGLGVDLVGNPDLLLEPKYAALSAGWFWNKHNLNDLADKADIETMTKRINGGLLGLDARKAAIQKAESVLG
jgi:putative chitinase